MWSRLGKVVFTSRVLGILTYVIYFVRKSNLVNLPRLEGSSLTCRNVGMLS